VRTWGGKVDKLGTKIDRGFRNLGEKMDSLGEKMDRSLDSRRKHL
jgi:UDP-N-acetylglucosamine enolpyruvyl transferase